MGVVVALFAAIVVASILIWIFDYAIDSAESKIRIFREEQRRQRLAKMNEIYFTTMPFQTKRRSKSVALQDEDTSH